MDKIKDFNNNFIPIAIKIIPKILSIIIIPVNPIFLCIHVADFKKIYMVIQLIKTARTSSSLLISEFRAIKVDNVPGPAIKGNAIGNIVALEILLFGLFDSSPKTILIPK